MFFQRITHGSKQLGLPVNVSRSPATFSWLPRIVLMPNAPQHVFILWQEIIFSGGSHGGDILFARSQDGGKTFSPPINLSNSMGGDGKGRINRNIWHNGSYDLVIAPSKAYSDAPKLAVDPGGGLHLVYAESAGGPFERYRIHYMRSTDGARSFEAPREISTPPPQSVASAGFPALSIDAKGRIYVLWELFLNSRQQPHGLGISISPDGGRSFSAPTLVPDSADPGSGANGSHQGLLMKKLAVNSTGAVAVVNSSLKQDAYSWVWLMRAQNK